MTKHLHFHALEKEMATIPVFLPGESQRRRSLVGCRLWDRTESDSTEVTQQQQQQQAAIIFYKYCLLLNLSLHRVSQSTRHPSTILSNPALRTSREKILHLGSGRNKGREVEKLPRTFTYSNIFYFYVFPLLI